MKALFIIFLLVLVIGLDYATDHALWGFFCCTVIPAISNYSFPACAL